MVQEVKLSEGELNDMATSADDISDDVKSAGDALSGGGKPNIAGFETLSALQDVANRWDDKVSRSAGKWTTHADNMRTTADHVVGTDHSNKWYIQDAGN